MSDLDITALDKVVDLPGNTVFGNMILEGAIISLLPRWEGSRHASLVPSHQG